MKSYKQLLEELSPGQKKKVDSWSTPGEESEADKISSHVFPVGHDRMTIPLEHEDSEVEPHPLVKHAMDTIGMKIKDYRKGTAIDHHGREVGIGKILNKHKSAHPAMPQALKAFANDPERASSKHNNLQVVISKHPHDVAGMSTNRGWTSCMNMKDGSNADYLKNDIYHGTHVAYLTHAGDHEAKNPIARIALKPFNAYANIHNLTKHTILRPEDTMYGDGHDAFSHTVNKFAEKHYPMLNDKPVYLKNPSLYNDSHSLHKINYDHPDLVKNTEDSYHADIAKNGKKEHLDQLVHSPNENVKLEVALHGHKEHLDKLVKDDSVRVQRMIASKGHKEHLDHFIKWNNDESVRSRVASFGHKEHLDHIMRNPDTEYSSVLTRVAEHGHKEHLDNLVNDSGTHVRMHVALHGHKEHLDKLVNDPEVDVRKQVARKGDRSHVNQLLNDPNGAVRMHAMKRDEELYNQENPLK